MYTVINHLHTTVPVDDLSAAMERDGLALLAAQPGFQRVVLVKESNDRCTALLFWDSQDEAIEGGKQFGPTWFATNVAPHLASEQVRTMGEVVIDHHH